MSIALSEITTCLSTWNASSTYSQLSHYASDVIVYGIPGNVLIHLHREKVHTYICIHVEEKHTDKVTMTMKWQSGDCWLAKISWCIVEWKRYILITSQRDHNYEKYFFVENLQTIFAYLMPNWSYIEYFGSLLTDGILNSMRTFRRKCHWKLSKIYR